MGDPKEHFNLEPVGGKADTPTGADGRPLPPPPPPPPAPAPSGTSTPSTAPVERHPSSSGFTSPADAPPLLELAEDHCPKCGALLSHDAVFCIKCGYDLRTNEVRQPTLGVEHVAEKPVVEEPVFSAPGGRGGRGNVQLLVGVGAALTIGAMVFAGINALPPTFLPVSANVLLSLYETALHTGTGIIAVLIAARVANLKIGRLDLAAARIFVAFAAFQLVHSITFGEYRTLVKLAMYPLALAAYWGLVMFLFRKPRTIAATVLIAHFVLWFAIELGMGLSAYVSRMAQNTVIVERTQTSPPAPDPAPARTPGPPRTPGVRTPAGE